MAYKTKSGYTLTKEIEDLAEAPEHGEIPSGHTRERRTHTPEEVSDAVARLDALRLPVDSKSIGMTDDEIRQARLIDRGLVPEDYFT